MLKPKMEKMLNEQINKEFYASYLYLDMAAKCSEMGRPGFAKWFKLQAKEEIEHAMKIYSYIHEQGGNVKLDAIDKPNVGESAIKDLFEKALEHEKYVTKSINELMDEAVKSNDYATQIFLQWFIMEQLEEESSVQEIIDSLNNMGDSKAGLYVIGRKLYKREE